MWSTHYSCQISMKLEFSTQIFEKCSNIEIHENPSGGSRVVPCGQMWQEKCMLVQLWSQAWCHKFATKITVHRIHCYWRQWLMCCQVVLQSCTPVTTYHLARHNTLEDLNILVLFSLNTAEPQWNRQLTFDSQAADKLARGISLNCIQEVLYSNLNLDTNHPETYCEYLSVLPTAAVMVPGPWTRPQLLLVTPLSNPFITHPPILQHTASPTASTSK
jgi:hypothetical protein